MKKKKFFHEKFPFRITLIYLAFGLTWILLSDKLLSFLISDVVTLSKIQTYKGFFFILMTALLLFVLLWRHMKTMKLAEKELIDAKEKAENSNRLKNAFLQNISHEIRTPMNAICGFTSLMTDPDLNPEQKADYSAIVRNNCDQLLTIITDVLTLSSVETKQMKVTIQEVNLTLMMEELTQLFQSTANSLSLDLQNSTNLPESQAFVLTDRTKLIQILTNLLTNALKFTKEGSIELNCHLENKQLVFYVKDTGIGFNPALKELLFERFRQANEDTNRRYGGTGLGLAISKALVELLGGQIGVETEQGKGSVFHFTIPYVASGSVLAESVKPFIWNKGFTILVAEDEDVNFLFLETLLQPMNWKVLRARNGQEAVDMVRADESIRLVLMDIRMPVLDGFQAAIAIKEFRPNLPILAQTAYANEQEMEQFRSIFDDYLTKPLRIQVLKQKISKFLA